MPRLSIIIGSVSGSEPLERTLVSVLQNRPDDCEVIVVHQGTYDDPYDLQGEVRFIAAADDASLPSLFNSGVEAAKSPIIHLLQSGLEIAEGWADIALAAFDSPRIGSVSPLILHSDKPNRIVAAGVAYGMGGGRRLVASGRTHKANRTSQRRILGPTLSAGFYRREVFIECGLLDASVGEHLADVDHSFLLLGADYQTLASSECQVFVGGGLPEGNPNFRTGLNEERFFWRRASAIGWGRSLAAHPFYTAWDFLQGLPRFGAVTKVLGRAAGTLLAALGRIRSSSTAKKSPEPAKRSAIESYTANRGTPKALRIDSEHQITPGRRSGNIDGAHKHSP